MSVTVRIPTALRAFTAGAKEVSAEGTTIGEVFKNLIAQHPDIEARLLDEDGVLRSLNVYINPGDRDIKFEDGLNTPVADGQEVSILAAVAGG